MSNVAVLGVGMTHFGKMLDHSIKDLVREAVEKALKDAGVTKAQIGAAYVGNAAAGIMTGQEMIRGQVTLSAMGIDTIPIYNIESACAGSSAAFNLAWTAVNAGMHECVLIVGFEKLYDTDKRKSFKALGTGVDIEEYLEYFRRAEAGSTSGEKIFQSDSGGNRSVFMDLYSFLIKDYMKQYGLTREHFAMLSVKSHKNGALNPHAQYRKAVTLSDVLNSGDVVFPLTRMMCSPIGDGAAAIVLCHKNVVRKYTSKPIWVEGSVYGSGKITYDRMDTATRRLIPKLYETSGIGPEDIDVVEVHDATSPSEIMFLIELGLCKGEDAPQWIENGALEIGGRMPSNPSGGLTTKGHPVAATGASMIHEIVTQLRGQAGGRQVPGDPKIGMTHNGGGILGIDAASMAIHLFKK